MENEETSNTEPLDYLSVWSPSLKPPRRIIPIGVLKVNFLDHLSTPMNGSILSRSSYLPYSIPTPVGAIILWPETAMKFLQHIRVFVKWSL